MALKIFALVLGVIALFMTFRAEWVLKTLFKAEEPDDGAILKMKYAAFVIAAAAFIIVFLIDKA